MKSSTELGMGSLFCSTRGARTISCQPVSTPVLRVLMCLLAQLQLPAFPMQ